jgi:hypothetical protein
MMKRFYDFGGEREFFAVSDEESRACPWYMRQLMDQDMIHLTVSDLSDPEPLYDDLDGDVENRKASTDFVCFLATPAVIRQLGYNPEGLLVLKDYKKKSIDLIRSIAPMEIKNSVGLFRERIQKFLNESLTLIYQSSNFDDAKSFVGEVLCFLGVDYPLEALSEEDIVLYNTTYLSWAKTMKVVGLVDELRLNNSHYSKKIPDANLWDIKDFLEAKASFISSAFYRSFLLSKKDPSDKEWVRLYDEAEKSLSLVDRVLIKISEISTVNKKKEVWVLNTHDFFYSILKKKLITLAEEIQQGLREDFLTFHLPEEVQSKILNPRTIYRPWSKK